MEFSNPTQREQAIWDVVLDDPEAMEDATLNCENTVLTFGDILCLGKAVQIVLTGTCHEPTVYRRFEKVYDRLLPLLQEAEAWVAKGLDRDFYDA